MQFTTIATLLFVALGAAAPTEYPSGGEGGEGGSGGKGGSQCPLDQKAACCNGGSTNVEGEGILSGVLSGVLSGQCTLDIASGCAAAAQACCETSQQQGLVNVGTICVPVAV